MNEGDEWLDWHRQYEPGSALSRRLEVVQSALREALAVMPEGELRLVSMCAGDGRDVIGVLPGDPRRNDVHALLVELEPRLAAAAQRDARQAGLSRLTVRHADAGNTEAFAGFLPAHLVMACGVFGNISDDDVRTTIRHLPELCAGSAHVIWTRGRFEPDLTPSIREWFAQAGFEEVDFTAIEGSTASVGHHVLRATPRPWLGGQRMFTFLEYSQRPSNRGSRLRR